MEYQAAGLIAVVNDSGGPKQDIVVDIEGGGTGFRATSAESYAEGFGKALGLEEGECKEMRARARASSRRFSTAVFAKGWVGGLETLVGMRVRGERREREGKETG